MTDIHIATSDDLSYLLENDHHISHAKMRQKVELGEVLVLLVDDHHKGWLRFGYFWDEIPFMNMLNIEETRRGLGYGRTLVQYWEAMMQQAGYDSIMTSTQSDEQAQHFYRKLGYQDQGALLLPNEPTELFFYKRLT